jgi:hypothetical protein
MPQVPTREKHGARATIYVTSNATSVLAGKEGAPRSGTRLGDVKEPNGETHAA